MGNCHKPRGVLLLCFVCMGMFRVVCCVLLGCVLRVFVLLGCVLRVFVLLCVCCVWPRGLDLPSLLL